MSRAMFGMAILATGLLATAARADTIDFHATLNGASEVPATTAAGKGMATATLDTATRTFNYMMTYEGLSGVATAAHFHGPALANNNAPPVVPIAPVTTPIKGVITLTEAQVADLEAGKWYVNVHTTANPGGEIRGQVMKGK